MRKTKRAVYEIRKDADRDFLRWAGLGNIDLSACPSVATVTDTNFHDDRFAPLANDGSVRSLDLKRFLRKSQTGDAEVRGVLDQAVREGRLPQQSEREEAKTYHIDGEPVRVEPRKDGTWQARHHEKLFVGSTREGTAMLVARETRSNELTPEQKLEIARKVSAVHTALSTFEAEDAFVEAVRHYVFTVTGITDEQTLSAVRYLPIINDALQFCWEHVRSDFSPGPDWSDFLKQFATGRPYDVRMLDAARIAYEAEKRATSTTAATNERSTQPAVEAPSPDALGDLSDEDVNGLMRGVRRERAKQARRAWYTST